MSQTKKGDPESSAWSRRQFAKATAIGTGAALLASWTRGFADTKKAVVDPTAKSREEVELDGLASSAPHLHAICEDAIAHLKYAFTVAASGKAAGAGHDFTDLFKELVAARKPKAKEGYAQVANALLAAPLAQRQKVFSHYATVTPATFATTKVEALPKLAKPAAALTLEHLASFSTPSSMVVDKPEHEKKEPDKDVTEGKKFKKIEFFISEVKDIENNGDIFEGSNEIAMGGVAVGATGHTEKIKQFHVKDGFDTGSSSKSTKIYKGGKTFATIEVQPDLKLPHEYLVEVVVAELDNGGFGDWLEKMWEKVKNYVKAALVAAGGAIGAAALSWIPGIGPIIGFILGAVIGWIIGLFKNPDDIVGHKTSTLRLHSVAKSYYEKLDLTKPKGIPVVMDFTDDGHYRVTGGWRLVGA
jgi:hypothetical protein